MKNKQLVASLLAVLTTFMLISCSKEIVNKDYLISVQVTDELQAYEDFAIILSKAVSNEPELRAFLKREALKKYDKDYDVFYPWTKNLPVDGQHSFREILERYDTDARLESVEKSIPLLTILVPDWSWANDIAFSVNNWDTSIKTIVVGYMNGEKTNSLYHNGEYYDAMPSYIIPEFPIVLIKNNERMKIESADTKGGPFLYGFVDEEFNGSASQTKSDYYYEHINNPSNPASDTLSTSSIPLRVREAYTHVCSEPQLKQRDYIYYGMTESVDSGYIDLHYAERLWKCKINPMELNYAFTDDHISNTQPDWNTTITFNGKISGLPNTLTDTELFALDWVDGEVELCFDIYAGNIHEQRLRAVEFKEAFQVSRVYEHYHYVWIDSMKYRTYYVEKVDLVPKWINLNFNLFTWDLSSYPNSYYVTITEIDCGVTRTQSFTKTFNMSANVSGTKKTNWGISAGANIQCECNLTDTQDSEELGVFNVFYADPVVMTVTQYIGYSIVPLYSTNTIDVIVMPVKKY